MANPFGINDETWQSLSEDQRRVIIGISEHDLSWLVGSTARSLGAEASDDDQRTAIEELKKFLAVKVMYDPHPLGMVSPLVGVMWKTFVLHTAEYEAFSQKFYGNTIHLIPGGATGQPQDKWLSLYKSLFGEFPDVWAMDKTGQAIPNFKEMLKSGRFLSQHDMDSDDGAFP